ncbi:transporter [Dokdonella sp.]|uniref:transporter n=1 Tax=Dokdonella sp. TaxID=2291710 RepID=UPI0031BFD784|nr:transporter [Dokdonella sp.]
MSNLRLGKAPFVACLGLALLPAIASADDASDLAKKLSNPVAALISVPFQVNYNQNIGPAEDGDSTTLNIQPVIPISISEDWNMISRTIVPLATQSDVFPGAGTQSGLGDITQSLFFSPKAPTSNGLIWGAGPAILIPTGADGISAKQWGLGPTLVVLKQSHGWTYGALANQIWSVASVRGESNTPGISSAFIQPFLSYTTPTAWTYGLNTESTYNWKTSEWTVPLNFTVAKLTRIGSTPVSFTGGVRYYTTSPDNGAHGWGFRFVVTLLYPKH